MAGAFTVEVEGAALAGEASGTGTPLVMLHGMGGERHDWDRLIAALPVKFPTLRYDLRGFGQSSRLDGKPYSHTDDLLTLLDARGIVRAPVLGLSMGGGIALNFALRHPERVSRLILISPAMVGWEWSDEWKALWRAAAGPARAGDMALARDRWYGHPMFAMLRESDAAAGFRASLDRYHGDQWVRDYQRDELPDLNRLPALAVPTLLLTGERDVADMRLIADMIAGAAPGVTRIDFAGAGHMLHLERTEDVAAAISTFSNAQ